MKTIKSIYTVLFLLIITSNISCTKDLEKLNENPNGADPALANPNLVLSTVLTQTGMAFTNLGFGDVAGVMQYTQKDGWTGGHNTYDWGGNNSWGHYYDILRNNQFVHDKAIETQNELLEGITLVMKSMLFGLLTDLYGDVPYESALNGNKGGKENIFPVYQDQQSIYEDILINLGKANTLLSKSKNDYPTKVDMVDVYYQGNPAKWRKLANSLSLRYYLRISEKLPAVAKAGIEKIVNDPANFPIITAAGDDASMSFPGNGKDDSWPTNVTYDSEDGSTYRRIKMGQPFVQTLLDHNDPRLALWASKVKIFLQLDENLPPGTDKTKDTTVNGEARKVRYISPDIISSRGLTPSQINQNPNYVGLPIALTGPQAYNLSPDLNQASRNPHVSWLSEMYQSAKGPLLKSRLMSAAEVHFIIAEAAVKGWTTANAGASYNAGIKASLDAWGLGGMYAAYVANPKVIFDQTQKQIITQKWIANWTNATEAWFDFRRTGFPEIHGVAGRTIAPELPVRFYYPKDEQRLNSTNQMAASNKLESTPFSAFGADGNKNSPWSKMWLLQGTGKPW